jgi:hypothetical protein
MLTQEALENFISKNVDEILTEASNHLKESLEKEVKLLMEELEEYKLKFKKLSVESSKSSVPSKFLLRDSGDSSISESTKEKLSINIGKVEIQEKVFLFFFFFHFYFILFFLFYFFYFIFFGIAGCWRKWNGCLFCDSGWMEMCSKRVGSHKRKRKRN